MLLLPTRMKLPRPCLALALVLAALPAVGATLVDDKFTSPTLAGRDLSPGRGVWKLADGVATCTQDDDLYTKNKSHGPIIWYNAKFTDATIRFAIRAEKVKQFVFTLNNDKGHVFRYTQSETVFSARAWGTQGKEAKPDAFPVKNGPKLAEGEWVQAELKFAGDQCTLQIGSDFTQTFTHPAIAKDKTKLGLGFAFGTLQVKDVSISTP